MAEYVIKRYFLKSEGLGNEAKFQLLLFTYNCIVLRKIQITLSEFSDFINDLAWINPRFSSLILNCFDVFLANALFNKENTGNLLREKIECWKMLKMKMDNDNDQFRKFAFKK